MIVMSSETGKVFLVPEQSERPNESEPQEPIGGEITTEASAAPSTTREVQVVEDTLIRSRQEIARTRSMYGLLVILSFCVLGIALFVGKIISTGTPEEYHENVSVSVQLITLVWTSIVTLVSGGLAFYFGNKN
jgi:hypothetical protein